MLQAYLTVTTIVKDMPWRFIGGGLVVVVA
jgi:hypothetical protein